ncbi:MAG: helix-turn-helix domain-containing protein [Bacteroidota bacterium]
MSGAIPRHILKPPPGTIREIDLIDWAPRAKAFAPEKPHRHQFYELLIITGTGGEHDLNFSSFPMKRGGVHFVGPDDVHLVFREKASAGCTLLFLPGVLDRPLLRMLPFGAGQPVLQLPPIAFKRLLIYMSLIRTELQEKESGHEQVLRSLVQSLAVLLARCWDRPGNLTRARNPLVDRFTLLVQQHFAEHLRVEDYAERLRISPKHLIAVSKEHTGQTPLNIIRDHLVAESKKLLYHTDLSVKEIAYRLGFDDPGNFSKYFRSATGFTPVEYRAGIRE